MTSVYDQGRSQRVAREVLDFLGIPTDEAYRMAEADIPSLIAATKKVFDEVPVRNPGTLAFVPIVDGDLLPRLPGACGAGRPNAPGSPDHRNQPE